MIEYHNPDAPVGIDETPYELSVDLASDLAASVGLLANGFPDSVEFLNAVGTALQKLRPGLNLKAYNKGNASIPVSVLLEFFCYNLVAVMIGRLLLHKRRKLVEMRKKGVRLLITHYLPISFFSVLVSVLYVTAESLGCIARRREEDVECWDVVQSNRAFAYIFVTFFFVVNLVLPFRNKKPNKR